MKINSKAQKLAAGRARRQRQAIRRAKRAGTYYAPISVPTREVAQ